MEIEGHLQIENHWYSLMPETSIEKDKKMSKCLCMALVLMTMAAFPGDSPHKQSDEVGLPAEEIIFPSLEWREDEAKSRNPQMEDPLSETELEIMAYLEGYGFNLERITFDGPEIVYDGDVTLSKGFIEQSMKFEECSAKKQRHYDNLVSSSNIQDVKLKIDSNVPRDWVNAVQAAVFYYNLIADCKVRFRIVTSGQDVNIRYESFTIKYDGLANGPWNGKPGTYVKFNRLTSWTLSYSKKIFVAAHELGHVIGVGHNDDAYWDRIPGTPSSDPSSIFNRATREWNGFSYYDTFALSWMYPDVE